LPVYYWPTMFTKGRDQVSKGNIREERHRVEEEERRKGEGITRIQLIIYWLRPVKTREIYSNLSIRERERDRTEADCKDRISRARLQKEDA
jgi:hypothetical protein